MTADRAVDWLARITRKPEILCGFVIFPLLASLFICEFRCPPFVDLLVYVLGSEGTIFVAFAFTASEEVDESQARRFGRVVRYYVERLIVGLVLLLTAALLNALR